MAQRHAESSFTSGTPWRLEPRGGHLAGESGLAHRSRGWPSSRSRTLPLRRAPPPLACGRCRRSCREFSANTIDDKASTWPLRPLVKPLYRYEGKHDGALFALVQGTDPEAFILLEARGEGKDAHWEYAVTRFTDLEIHVRLKDREVFSGPHTLGQANEIYNSPTVMNKPSDSPEDFD